MSDYDKMSVADLVRRTSISSGFQLPALESALRRAVIKEATVGEVKVEFSEHYDEIARPEDPERIVTMTEQIISKAWVPEGEYLLVKKEG